VQYQCDVVRRAAARRSRRSHRDVRAFEHKASGTEIPAWIQREHRDREPVRDFACRRLVSGLQDQHFRVQV
jgi:hypothetical protein